MIRGKGVIIEIDKETDLPNPGFDPWTSCIPIAEELGPSKNNFAQPPSHLNSNSVGSYLMRVVVRNSLSRPLSRFSSSTTTPIPNCYCSPNISNYRECICFIFISRRQHPWFLVNNFNATRQRSRLSHTWSR